MRADLLVAAERTGGLRDEIAQATQQDLLALAPGADAVMLTWSSLGPTARLFKQALAYRIHCENLRATLCRLVDTDFEIILDTVLRDEVELQACLDVLSARPLCLVGIQAPLARLEQRESLRDDRAAGMAREQLPHPAFARSYDLADIHPPMTLPFQLQPTSHQCPAEPL